MHSNPKSRLLIESISLALLAARDHYRWSLPMPAVNVSYTGNNHVMVHLLPIGVFGPYSRSQIPHQVVSDLARTISADAQPSSATSVQRKQLTRRALPAPLSIAQLISHAALSADVGSRSEENESEKQGNLKC